MIKRELAKDPALATESWDRFLPKFRKRHLKTSEKTSKKNEKLAEKNAAREAAGLAPIQSTKDEKKKVYTPFPPAQQPRKVDLQLESGEYFLKSKEKEAREAQRRKEKVRLCVVRFREMANTRDRSKRKSLQKSKQNVLRHSLHQLKLLHPPSRKSGGENGKRRMTTRVRQRTTGPSVKRRSVGLRSRRSVLLIRLPYYSTSICLCIHPVVILDTVFRGFPNPERDLSGVWDAEARRVLLVLYQLVAA